MRRLQPGKDRRALGTLERDPPGDRCAVLGDFYRLAPAHASDHLAGVVPQLPQPD